VIDGGRFCDVAKKERLVLAWPTLHTSKMTKHGFGKKCQSRRLIESCRGVYDEKNAEVSMGRSEQMDFPYIEHAICTRSNIKNETE
jgi:hypothetical protein